MRDLHVGAGVTWPAKLTTTTTALLGIRGAGKSNLARVIAEEAYRSKIPVVVFDPVGNWYGIRAGKDGKPDGGLPFAIFGGRHGDVPLEAGAGQLIADTIIDTRLSCVIDMSHEDFSEGDKCHFLTAFGDRLFRRKQPETGWILLVLEEADDYAPQSRGGGGGVKGPAAATLGVFQRLVKRCRFKGLGTLLVTQRSAALNKDLLNMADTLVAFRTTAPHDQDAVEGWIKHHSLSAEAMKTISQLPAGEAWVWSPEALGTFARTKFRRMDTLDTGRTPEHVAGKAAAQPTLADVDLPGLRKKMADTIERAKENDPRELRRQLAEARAELAKAKTAKVPPAPKAVALRPALKDSQVKRLETIVSRAERIMESALGFREAFESGAERIKVAVGVWRAATLDRPPVTVAVHGADKMSPKTREAFGALAHAAVRHLRKPSAPAEGITPARQRILDALAWCDSVGLQGANRTQLAFLADASPKSSAYQNNLGALRTSSLIDYGSGGTVFLTPGGRGSAAEMALAPTTGALQASILRRLPPARARIVSALIRVYPQTLERAALADLVSASATSSAYQNNLGALRSLGLIDYVAGEVVALDVLFLPADR